MPFNPPDLCSVRLCSVTAAELVSLYSIGLLPLTLLHPVSAMLSICYIAHALCSLSGSLDSSDADMQVFNFCHMSEHCATIQLNSAQCRRAVSHKSNYIASG